jgi:PGF-CTERM protein
MGGILCPEGAGEVPTCPDGEPCVCIDVDGSCTDGDDDWGYEDHDGHDDGNSDDGESDLFAAADSDNDGLVTTSDIVNAILSMDAPTPQDALDQGDMDQSDSISWDEFVQMWNMDEDESDADDQHLNNNPQLESDFHAAFNNSDADYDGNLSIDELQSFIDDVVNLSSTQEEITEMTTIFAPYVACVDGNSDGSLDQVEFSDFYGAVMYGMENTELVFCTLDSNQDGTVTVSEYVDFINQTGMYSEEYPMTEEDWEGFTSLIGMYDTDDIEGLSPSEYQSMMVDISPGGGGDGGNWEPYHGGYCEWEGDPTDDDNVWSCKDDESDTEWDTWWYYCELHGEDWFCTDDYGQSPDWEYSATGTLYQDNGGDGDHTDNGHNDHADHDMAYDWVIQSADMMSETELIGAFADYEIVLANCAESDSDEMMGTTELDCGEDVMKVTIADANVSGAQIMFHDTDMSGTITAGDMIHIDPDIDAGGEWNTVRLYSASTQTYSDENPMLPGFGAAAGLIALLGAALLTRRD